jgi:hypothetical protein
MVSDRSTPLDSEAHKILALRECMAQKLLKDARRLIQSWGVYSLTWTLRDRSRERAPQGCA